jgi:ribA/ribD-fused uncharacterized protein
MEEKFTLFWGGPASQWAMVPMIVEEVGYNCCEQYMMSKKAGLFGDMIMLAKIMAEGDPSKQKAYGKKVANFNKNQWEAVAKDVVYRANIAKFSQNSKCRNWLFSTEGTTLVEASPYDKIWGIGLAEDNPDALDRSKWQGTNWLGEVVTQVRDDLMSVE